ncbi:MAG TPA: response regulator [Rhizomicrobium sp.]|nr:response regulator [Rhizomicrobium sp.]
MREVLIAEDEPMLRVLAVEVLQEAGFRVFEAADGSEALDLLRQNPEIKTMVSDVKMPRMDGYALSEAALALRPELRIVLTTGYAQEPPANIARHKQIQTLQKPFDLVRLTEILESLIS